MQENITGCDSMDIAKTHNNLAVLLKLKGELKDAEELHLKSILIKERSVGACHSQVKARAHARYKGLWSEPRLAAKSAGNMSTLLCWSIAKHTARVCARDVLVTTESRLRESIELKMACRLRCP